jgi:hypothetical protein
MPPRRRPTGHWHWTRCGSIVAFDIRGAAQRFGATPPSGGRVELVRCHLAPLRNRRSLTASFGREAFQTLDLDRARPRPLGPIRAAYAIRWLELGNGAALPAWSSLITMETSAS